MLGRLLALLPPSPYPDWFQALTKTLFAWSACYSHTPLTNTFSTENAFKLCTHFCVLSSYASVPTSFTPTFNPPSFVQLMLRFSMLFLPRSPISFDQA